MMRIASVGHAVFAATMIVVGILGLVDPLWQGVPRHFPGHDQLAYLAAVVLLACGVGLTWRRTAAPAAGILLVYLLLSMLVFKMPVIVRHPLVEGAYQSWGQTAVIVAAAWVLYAWFATGQGRPWLALATGNSGVRIARAFYGLALIAFGLSHFAYVDLTAPLVPAWLPWHLFWAYFTGTAYLAAGVAILTSVFARLAAALATFQIGGFTFLVWVPMLASGQFRSITGSTWTEFVVSCMLTASAWVVADSYRDAPWLGRART
jgi:uncharacterized membrane protein